MHLLGSSYSVLSSLFGSLYNLAAYLFVCFFSSLIGIQVFFFFQHGFKPLHIKSFCAFSPLCIHLVVSGIFWFSRGKKTL